MIRIIKTYGANPFLIAYMVALILLATTGYMLSGYAINQELEKQEASRQHFTSDVGFVMLPRVNMSISPNNGQASRVRADIGLEVQQKNLLQLEGVTPRITDRLVAYMQKLKTEDIRHINSEPWLRKEILEQVNMISYPVPVIDIVFRQLVIL